MASELVAIPYLGLFVLLACYFSAFLGLSARTRKSRKRTNATSIFKFQRATGRINRNTKKNMNARTICLTTPCGQDAATPEPNNTHHRQEAEEEWQFKKKTKETDKKEEHTFFQSSPPTHNLPDT
jgi:hypothetical protein